MRRSCASEMMQGIGRQAIWHTINSIHFAVSMVMHDIVCARCLCYITRETSLLLFDLCILYRRVSGWWVEYRHKMHVIVARTCMGANE